MTVELDIAQLRGHIESLHRTLEHQTRIMSDVHHEIGSLRRENVELREVGRRQRRTIAHLQTDIITLKEQIKSLSDEKAKYAHDLQIWQAKFRFLENENNMLREELRRINNKTAP